jgi:hypothetical protein
MGLTVPNILKAISDKKALALFETIALAESNTEILITKTQLAHKQDYSRMSGLRKSGFVDEVPNYLSDNGGCSRWFG